MRLTKVRKALKEAGIPYDYKEVVSLGYVFGEIRFRYDGKLYRVDEITGNRGRKPSGIFTNIPGCKYGNQTKIAEVILKKNF